MKKLFMSLSYCFVFLMAVSAPIHAEETPKGAPAMSAEQEKMMKAFEAAGKVTDQHKSLEFLVGNWNVKSIWWQAPNAKPQESAATASFKSMFDGKFMAETYQGNWMGKPFEGVGYMGYDNMKNKYTTLWMDNMSTAVFHFEGDSPDKGKTITSSCTFLCPLTGANKTVRSVMKKISKNEFKYEHYDVDEKGKEFKSMELVYKRS